MNVQSLGYRTDLIFHAFDGEIVDRGHYLVIRTPANPAFYWGNFLLFSRPPEKGDFDRWRDLFRSEIGSPPRTAHQVFGWDAPNGEQGVLQPFLEAGFRFHADLVLTSTENPVPTITTFQFETRELQADSDWDQAVENQVLCRDPEFGEEAYRAFRTQQMERYRRMVEAGLGGWFGAFAGQQLVADLGLFHGGSIGRFQSVQTHPDYRRRGLAGSLVLSAARQARSKYGVRTLVIVAKQNSSAARLYKSLGFRQAEQQPGLEWWPQFNSP